MESSFTRTSGITDCHTAREIQTQPGLWHDTFASISHKQEEIKNFLETALSDENAVIILTGAGTSSYIGDVLSKIFQRNLKRNSESIPTTDLITNPNDYFQRSKTTLLVSFARSGDSPESQAAVNLANECCCIVFHLIITCNPDGLLASNATNKNSYVLFMPKSANDKALAMTGSFSSMLLAGILISDLNNLADNKNFVDRLVVYGETILEQFQQKIKEVAKIDFKRAVFLGSGLLKGIARESQLKVQELTDGVVICKFDSFLGLRHGPQVVIDKTTLVVYLFSRDFYINQYEFDLVKSINESNNKLYEIGIGEVIKSNGKISLDMPIELASSNYLPEEYFAVCAILPAQLLGMYKSMNLGLSPDSPSVSKTINRVVQGVNIYPHQ
ncbi:MAG: SIS domain-containing protein [Cyclobacteriaceae bacterium]